MTHKIHGREVLKYSAHKADLLSFIESCTLERSHWFAVWWALLHRQTWRFKKQSKIILKKKRSDEYGVWESQRKPCKCSSWKTHLGFIWYDIFVSLYSVDTIHVVTWVSHNNHWPDAHHGYAEGWYPLQLNSPILRSSWFFSFCLF